MELKKIKCDVCRGKTAYLVGKPPIEGRLLARFPHLTKASVVHCTNCGFYFINPMPLFDKEEVKFIYDKTYFMARTRWWERRRNLDRINRLDRIEQTALLKVNKFLDVGCGEGWTLREAQRRGWDVLGLDVSNNLAVPLKSSFSDKILIGELVNARFASNYFDSIYIDSVLEHVSSPSQVMRECYRILKMGGCIYVGIPNEDSLMNDVKRLFFELKGDQLSSRLSPFRSPYHIVGFNKNCFKKIVEDCSFQIKKIRIFGGYYEFLKHYKSDFTVFCKSLVNSAIDSLGLLLGKGFYIEAWLIKK